MDNNKQYPKGLAETYRNIGDEATAAGEYFVAIPDHLIARAQQYYINHEPKILSLLASRDITGDTVAAVLQDYKIFLCGGLCFKASIKQIEEITNRPMIIDAFIADQNVFWRLLTYYVYIGHAYTTHENKIKNATSAQERAQFFTDYMNEAEGENIPTFCFRWLKDAGHLRPSDLGDLETGNRVLNYINAGVQLDQYANYIYTARQALNATPDEIQGIERPAVEVANFVESYNEFWEAKRRLYEETLAEEVGTEKKKKAQNEAEDVQLNKTISLLLSSPVYVARDEKGREVAPVQNAIKQFLKNNRDNDKLKLPPSVSPYKIDQVLGAINYLKNFAPNTNEPHYTIKTTISEFSDTCIGWDANEEEKTELIAALNVLHDLVLVIPLPNRTQFSKLIWLKEMIRHDSGRLDLEIYVSKVIGLRSNKITIENWKKMQSIGRGQMYNRFINALPIKTHKQEMGLLNDIFGYQNEIDLAKCSFTNREELEAELKRIEKNQKKNLGRDKKKLEAMFEKAQQEGLIKYTKKQVGKGNRGTIIYSYEWEFLGAVPLIEDAKTIEETGQN